MKQELPNLVDERRFRRREPEAVERDEFGRVSIVALREIVANRDFSANGQRRRYRSPSNQSQVSIFEPKL